MDGVAYYIGTTIIYWNSILLFFAILAAFFLSLAFYMSDHKYSIGLLLYLPLSVASSVFFARALHWFCNMEQYDGFLSAVRDASGGGYCIVGVLLGTWLPALLLSAVRIVKSRMEILDNAAPGIAFVLGMVRFGDIYSGECRGKVVIEDPSYCRLPFGVRMETAGIEEYRFAAFFVSFLLLMGIMVFLCIRRVGAGGKAGRYQEGAPGGIYHLFLLLYSMTEIFIDSIRYDSTHLFFPGQALANLNKGASFMGLSQLVAALTLIYLAALYFHRACRGRRGGRKKAVFLALFVLGLAAAGICEYFVQRYTGRYLFFYSLQILGILMMGTGIFALICMEGNGTSRNFRL